MVASYSGIMAGQPKVIGIIIAIIVVAIIFLSGCTRKETKVLAGVAISDYNGTKLSSLNDFRENSIKGPQYINISDYQLEIVGRLSHPKNYTYDELIKRQGYEKVVTLHCVEGWDVTILWKGILVKDLLDDVKPTTDANTVIFYAYDGYSVNFPLDFFKKNTILMAYEMNNVTLPPQEGYPFILVAEDKWGYKWIKWITKIELSNDTSYKGYWESRGYSKEGNLNESFYS
jgi:DMSO/TMAO reductase YedYZ molybdopterin-dependent catalytic subunit